MRLGSSRKLPMTWIVGGGFAALVGAAMAFVLALSLRVNFENTFALLNDKAVLTTRSLEYRLRAKLDQAAATISEIQRLYAANALSLYETRKLHAVMVGAVASNAAIDALLIKDNADLELRAVRTAGGGIETEDWRPVPAERLRQYVMDDLHAARAPVWGPLVSVPEGIYTNVTIPLRRNGDPDAYLTAAIPTGFLSRIAAELDIGDEMSTFVIARGSQVLAFSDLDAVPGGADGSGARLPVSLAEFGDPVLKAMTAAPVLQRFSAAQAEGVEVRHIAVDGADYILMSRELSGYGPHQWTIGAYFERASLAGEVQRMMASGVAGVLALLVAGALAFWLARKVTRPLSHIAAQSRRVAAIDFDAVEPLPRSRMAEIDQLAVAFNGMISGLRALNTYVPSSLFRKLMSLGIDEAARSREAELTILFTDIAGFTSQSEKMGAGEVARFLNDHFALLVKAVEDEGGTVDKFIGDGMLAFWGAPDTRPDHADAAVRAAATMTSALARANGEARAQGRSPTRVRIGMHTGRAIVGNIGAYDRVEYTIVGDAVNVSERLQELGRSVAPEAETVVLASDATLEAVKAPVPHVPAGRHRLRGRGAEVEVWRLFADGGGRKRPVSAGAPAGAPGAA